MSKIVNVEMLTELPERAEQKVRLFYFKLLEDVKREDTEISTNWMFANNDGIEFDFSKAQKHVIYAATVLVYNMVNNPVPLLSKTKGLQVLHPDLALSIAVSIAVSISSKLEGGPKGFDNDDLGFCIACMVTAKCYMDRLPAPRFKCMNKATVENITNGKSETPVSPSKH